jgi:hypothetical protein
MAIHWIFILSAALISICVFAVNILMRWKKGPPLSSGADALLLLIGFDVTVITNETIIRPLIVEPLQSGVIPIYLSLLFVCLLFWVLNVKHMEPKILSSYDVATQEYSTEFPYRFFGISWGVVLIAVSAHFLTFL